MTALPLPLLQGALVPIAAALLPLMLRHHARPEDPVLEVAVALADLRGQAAGEKAA